MPSTRGAFLFGRSLFFLSGLGGFTDPGWGCAGRGWFSVGMLQEEEEDSDDEGPIYNPLNLPLGWDGKPIPYWLYKLHGLGVEFKCEICGDFSYKGRRCTVLLYSPQRHRYCYIFLFFFAGLWNGGERIVPCFAHLT